MSNSSCLNLSSFSVNKGDTSLARFSERYGDLHGFASLTVCVFGIITNIFNISVLTRKSMATQTNVLLTWLAVSDLLTMLSYIPFAWHFYCANSPMDLSAEKNSFAWMTYFLIHISFSLVMHTISIWLGVSLAVLRFVQLTTVKRGAHEIKRRIKIAKLIVASVIVISVLVMIPNFLINRIIPYAICGDEENNLYGLEDLRLGTPSVDGLVLMNVITYGIFAKLLPCVLMCVFGGALLYNVGIKGGNRRRRLMRLASASSVRRSAGQSRTTRMLITVLILFLLTELPQAVFIFLSVGVSGFYYRVYQPLGDMMDIIALLNNAINFVLYCSMSQQFRERFLEMYCKNHHTLKFTANSLRSTINDANSTGHYNTPVAAVGDPVTRLAVNDGLRELSSNIPRTCTTELLSGLSDSRRNSPLLPTVTL